MQTTTDDTQSDREMVERRPAQRQSGPFASGINGMVLFFSHLCLFALGALLGIALTILTHYDFGRTAQAQAALAPQTANIVLVLTTATPSAEGSPSQPGAATNTQVIPDTSVTQTLAGARDYTRLGSANAPVQIVVYADPQCPFCRQLVLGPERQVITDYVKTGKVAITYRHYAFLGPESNRAAEAMECAGKQGSQAFWDYHDLIFENQFAENSGQLTDAKLLEWAGGVGLDKTKLSACLASGESKAIVDADMKAGAALSVSGTPVTFVNGRRLVGAVPYDFIKTAIDAELAGQK